MGEIMTTLAEPARHFNYRHGGSVDGPDGGYTPTYGTWSAMKQRCRPDMPYGLKGITVCDRWETSFEAFLTDMGERPAGMSIDRIDNTLGYFQSNCRWATRLEQNRNRRARCQPGCTCRRHVTSDAKRAKLRKAMAFRTARRHLLAALELAA